MWSTHPTCDTSIEEQCWQDTWKAVLTYVAPLARYMESGAYLRCTIGDRRYSKIIFQTLEEVIHVLGHPRALELYGPKDVHLGTVVSSQSPCFARTMTSSRLSSSISVCVAMMSTSNASPRLLTSSVVRLRVPCTYSLSSLMPLDAS